MERSGLFMQTTNQALLQLVQAGEIEGEAALAVSLKSSELAQALRGLGRRHSTNATTPRHAQHGQTAIPNLSRGKPLRQVEFAGIHLFGGVHGALLGHLFTVRRISKRWRPIRASASPSGQRGATPNCNDDCCWAAKRRQAAN